MVAYVGLGTLLVAGVLSIPQLSQALQQGMAKLLGPLLVVIGMVLLELLTVPTGNLPFAEGLRKRAESWGLLGAGLLGFIFALSFCPVSAALFFGSLVPLAVRFGSRVACPRSMASARACPCSSSPCSSHSGADGSAGRSTR